MKTQSAKAKGRKLQQFVRDMILGVFKQHLEKDDVKSTSMGAGGEDVQLSPLARKYFPYSVECKSRNNIAIYQWYDQAKVNCPTFSDPLLVVKANNRNALVCVDAEHFFNLIGDFQKERDNENRT